jgi:multidrug efflux pump subunit AcrA (membrane-fusion protein)
MAEIRFDPTRLRTLPVTVLLGATCLALFALRPAAAEDVAVPVVKINVIEEVDVPAQREGRLASLDVREGTMVRANTEIGRVDDAATRLAVQRAKLLVDLARKQAEGDAKVELARKALAEARAAVGRAELQLAVAQRTAENELAVRAAESAVDEAKAEVAKWRFEVAIAGKQAESTIDEEIARATTATAQNELNRAEATRRSVGDAVSASEVASLTLARDRAKLEGERAVELREIAGMTKSLKQAEETAGAAAVASAELAVQQAEFDHALDQLAVDAETLTVEQARLAVDTANVKVAQAEQEAEVVALNAAVAEADHAIAAEELTRHAVVTPVTGVVAERYKTPGTWVKPGESVVRVLRLDRLRAEAYVDALSIDAGDVGSQVLVTVPTRSGPRKLLGEVVHVSREVDSVNRQVLVWAEFDNPDFAVLPGVQGQMTIRLGTRAER